MYAVKEIFLTLQGEGAQTRRPAVFCPFAGCNLWSGREEDRAEAVCKFCDTDFVGTDGTRGGKDTADALAAAHPGGRGGGRGGGGGGVRGPRPLVGRPPGGGAAPAGRRAVDRGSARARLRDRGG